MGSADPIKIQNVTPLNMGTKMKGLIKGIKSISLSQIFDDDKKQEIQIGMPTDVKHVAHIGCDGPAVESPSWMEEFEATESQSGPLDKTGALVETPEVKWVSEDSRHRKARKDDSSHRSTQSEETTRDLPLLPRSTRHRHGSMENSMDSDSSTKTRRTRRHHKGSSEARRRSQDQSADVPKKSSRRKKSKEESSGGGSSRSSTRSIPNDSDFGPDVV